MTLYDQSTPGSRHLLQTLDQLALGPWNRKNQYMKEVCNILVPNHFGTFKPSRSVPVHFNRVVTAICWHPKVPYLYAAGYEYGDIVVGTVQRSRFDSRVVGLEVEAEIAGDGPEFSITAMKFDPTAKNILYRSSYDCKVSKIDLEDPNKSFTFHDASRQNERWFSFESMDVNFKSKLLASGDSLGNMILFDLDGKNQGSYKLHTNAIDHIEFSKKDPNLFVTAGAADGIWAVKLWDIRNINMFEPLYTLPHIYRVNVACFNPTDGSKLLTNDQKDEIRIYQGPAWNANDFVVIKHHHLQFEYMAPIKAAWHPLSDLIVIGKYPTIRVTRGKFRKAGQGRTRRTVQLYDPESRKLVAEINPPLEQNVSLNKFNPTGEYLASGFSGGLVVWKPSIEPDFEN